MGGFELLEHTADIGIRATGASLEEVFEHATVGLAELLGAWRPGPGEPAPVAVDAGDPGGLLVDWLNEVIWLREVRDAAVAGVQVEAAGEGRATGALLLAPPAPPVDGTTVKAATYHRLRVERQPGGWLAEVYLDV
ncbi:MAG TPA: archease [Actinomycetes bacterium]|jgi:SHS2 domain-containing protein|nr:archease [Actinomycetes bacterium]